ncbi:MAG: hypothetical protein FJ191_10550 [Gammaproteobacteria bacterium]|nr:hypothetical protein [Gammaproteobacteria bacterium]
MFLAAWESRSASELLRYNIENMPPGTSGTRSTAEHIDVVACLLWGGRYREGTKPSVTWVAGLTDSEAAPDGPAPRWESWSEAGAIEKSAKNRDGPTRSIAIYGDKLFMATYDAALVAVDARTGRQL